MYKIPKRPPKPPKIGIESLSQAISTKLQKARPVNLPKMDTSGNSNSSNAILRILASICQLLDEECGVTATSSNTSLIDDYSRSSLTSEMMEMMLDENIDAQNECYQKFQSLNFSADTRRKIIRHCIEIKRLMDKENNQIYADSPLQKAFFAKTSAMNVGILFRCLKEYFDVDSAAIITTLLARLISTAENGTSNASAMAKRNLTPILLSTLQAIHSEYFSQPNSNQVISPTLAQRIDEVHSNIFYLLSKMSKYEPKMALLARLHGTIPVTSKILFRAVERKDYPMMNLTIIVLRNFITKNENNLITAQRGNLTTIIESIVKSNSQSLNLPKIDSALDLLSHLCKAEAVAEETIRSYGMKFFLALASSNIESVQKASLKTIKTINEFDFGKKHFDLAEGSKYLSEILNNILQLSDNTGASLTSTNSVASLLVGALRSAAGHSELPFMERYKAREFPLAEEKKELKIRGIFTVKPDAFGKFRPQTTPEKSTLPSDTNNNLELCYEDLVDECAANLLEGKYSHIKNPPDSFEDLVRVKLRRLCPELYYTDNSPLPKCETPGSNISVRHVQPMAPGKHIVCRNTPIFDAEPLLRRSPAIFRKIMFDQTARMFQTQKKGTVVYDVMNPSVAQSFKSDLNTLEFDSRFESGNLQMAIKVSAFEYDLLLESDINSTPGKHNQWFYFSVKRMVSNSPYRFNILNMTKPNSQFNNGMQPVMYSIAEPGWKRCGDYAFYMNNHYLKFPQKDSPGDNDQGYSTFSTLTFGITFKEMNDHCFIAYHYPYTYSELQRSLFQFNASKKFKSFCRRSLLCRTLGGNDCILLTITDFEDGESSIPMENRKYVFLSGRVHPGETNSSHIIGGLIKFLMSSDEVAVNLRRNCIFKIVPMLNPDGVINGHHRCSLAGVDLNRQWREPSRLHSPTIFWTKLMYRFIVKLNKPVLLACDFHGHSRKKNLFTYGCDNPNPDSDWNEKAFSQILAAQTPLFDINSCKFNIEKSKETTARVVLRREFGILNSFTLESTYCGMDLGDKKGFQISILDLEKVGADFARAINTFMSTADLQVHCQEVFAKQATPSSESSSLVNTPKRARKVRKIANIKPGFVKKKSIKPKIAAAEKEEEQDESQSSDDDDDG